VRAAELFPPAVLAEAARSTSGPRTARPTEPSSTGAGAGRADDVGARVQGWLADDTARARTEGGHVAPVWRDVERALVQGFKPPVAVVHDLPDGAGARLGDRLKTFARQNLAVMLRGEDGLRRGVEPGATIVEAPIGRSIDPSQQSFYGVPEGMNLRAMPLEQQRAVVAATGEPASWLHAEVEITVDDEGAVVAARVAVPSGRRRFDRYALAEVQARVAGVRHAAATTRWAIEAGYAVSRPDSFGITFDLNALFDRASRRKIGLQWPLSDQVRTRVSLLWAKPERAP
jgi:hypothetical protein